MDINKFLSKVRKHLGSESDEFLNLQFSPNSIKTFNKNLHYFITNKIDQTPLSIKLAYIFKPNRFSDDYLARVSGLSKDVITKLRKNPRTRFAPKEIESIYTDIRKFYEYRMAKHYGLTYWNQNTGIKDLLADNEVKE